MLLTIAAATAPAIRAQDQVQIGVLLIPADARGIVSAYYGEIAAYGSYMYVVGWMSDYYLLVAKLDDRGNPLWAKSLPNTRLDTNLFRQSIAVAPDGSVYVVAFNRTSITYNIIKLYQNGAPAWAKSLKPGSMYRSGENAYMDGYSIRAIAAAPDGGVYVFGEYGVKGEESNNNIDLFVAKLGRDGNVERANGFGIPGISEGAFDIVVAPDGSIYVAGYLEVGIIKIGVFVAKLNPSGGIVWYVNMTSRSGQDLTVVVGSDRNIYVAETAINYLYVTKLSENGVLQWAKKIAGSSSWHFTDISAVRAAPDGGAYVAGYPFLAKLDSSGNPEWVKVLINEQITYSRVCGIAVTSLGCPIIIAETGYIYNYSYIRTIGIFWGYTYELDPSQLQVDDLTNGTTVSAVPRENLRIRNITNDVRSSFEPYSVDVEDYTDKVTVLPIYGAGLFECALPSSESVQTGRSLGGAAEPFGYWVIVASTATLLTAFATASYRKTK